MANQPRLSHRPWISRGGRVRRTARVTVVVVGASVGICVALVSWGLGGVRRMVGDWGSLRRTRN